MAAGQLSPRLREGQSAAKPSRRAVLGAAVALSFDTGLRQAQPLLRMSGGEAEGPLHPPSPLAAAGPPPRSGEEWDAALAAFEAAEAAVGEIEAATAGYSLEEEEALLPAHEAACDAMEAALGRLLLVPVPHLAALAVKFEAAFAHELQASPDDDLRFRALLQDIIRLHADG